MKVSDLKKILDGYDDLDDLRIMVLCRRDDDSFETVGFDIQSYFISDVYDSYLADNEKRLYFILDQ